MKMTIKAVCLLLTSLYAITGFSTTVHNFTSGVSIEAELLPKDPQIFYNFLLWKVRGSCEVISDSSENHLSFKMLNNKGTLNGVEFTPGEAIYLVANTGQRFELVAEPRAKVEVTNLGEKAIKIACSSS